MAENIDSVISFNKERWEELSASNVMFSVPWLDLTKETALQRIDPEGQLQTIENKNVLCLAASGGQQSVAFGLLGANVTVFDLSENQLHKDRVTAEKYGIKIKTIQGDMQNLDQFESDSFDIIWLAHSINFIPKANETIKQIARICIVRGKIRINFTNPYVHGLWDYPYKNGYLLSQPYIDGDQIKYRSKRWTFADPDGRTRRIEGPKEYRHSLSTIINGLISYGLTINGLWEDIENDPNPKVGSWAYFKRIAPPWLTVWAEKYK